VTDIAQALASSRIFQDFPEGFIQRLADVSRLQRFAAGEVVVREDEPATAFYVVSEGAFEVTRADGTTPAVVATLGPGDFFGETALLREGTRTATIRSLGEGACTVLPKDGFDGEMRKDPNAAAVLATRLAARINRFRKT
jgi:CRP-like cAMP-binding protein